VIVVYNTDRATEFRMMHGHSFEMEINYEIGFRNGYAYRFSVINIVIIFLKYFKNTVRCGCPNYALECKIMLK
jgi:hypothetical protein